MQYVVGLLFSQNLSQVLLIRKNRPEWQKGKLNGPGGLVENETFLEAMVREFKEETGLEVPGNRWRHVCTLVDNDVISFFAASGDDIDQAKTLTDEEVKICPVDVVTAPPYTLLVSPLNWIIPMAILGFSNKKSYMIGAQI